MMVKEREVIRLVPGALLAYSMYNTPFVVKEKEIGEENTTLVWKLCSWR
jgi:hypothetical protein